MSKRRFVQSVVIRTLPALDKLVECIRYAESVFEALGEYGYGAEAAPKPRESKDWFDALSRSGQAGFQEFWDAFGYKKGRNEAAMRWYQLGELTPDQLHKIVEAARKEADRQLPAGQARKMASGWLFEKRWLDHHSHRAMSSHKVKLVELSNLRNERTALQRLHEKTPDPAMAKQVETLTRRINALQQELACQSQTP